MPRLLGRQWPAVSYVYGYDSKDVSTAHGLTHDEARRIAAKIAKLLAAVLSRRFWRFVEMTVRASVVVH